MRWFMLPPLFQYYALVFHHYFQQKSVGSYFTPYFQHTRWFLLLPAFQYYALVFQTCPTNRVGSYFTSYFQYYALVFPNFPTYPLVFSPSTTFPILCVGSYFPPYFHTPWLYLFKHIFQYIELLFSTFSTMPRRRASPTPRPKRRRTQPARLRSESSSPPRPRQQRLTTPPPRSPTPTRDDPHRFPTLQHQPPVHPAAVNVANTIAQMQAAFVQQQQLVMDAMHTLQTSLNSQNQSTHLTTGHTSASPAVGACLPAMQTAQPAAPSHTYTPTAGPDITHRATSEDTQGEHLQIVYQPTTRPLRTTAAPLGHSLPHSLKVKIWQHKFVELSDLITTTRSTDYTLAMTTEEGLPQFSLASKKKKPLTENQWCQAMDTFIAVYVQRYPTEIGQILSYAQSVKDLMANKANWAWYDTQYRTDREFSICQWDEVRQDLELRAFRQPMTQEYKPFRSYNNYSTGNSKSKRYSDDKVPPGYCFTYHSRGQRCTSHKCSFKHTCPRCRGSHPIFMRCSNRNSSPSARDRDTRRDSSPKHHDSRDGKKLK